MLGRLEAKLDLVLQNQERAHDERDAIASRVTALETSRARLLGWMTGVAAAAGFAMALLEERLRGFFG